MEIRKVKPEDFVFVAELMGELGYPATALQVSTRLQRLLDAGEEVYVAELESQVVGLICYASRPHLNGDGTVGRVTNLVVHSKVRQSGIGRKLMEFIEGHARSRGDENMELTTRLHRTEAHHFYLKIGYKETSKKFTKRLS